ncbi:MAG: threonine synthase [Euryarchaeota archaeon]|nr:threonine synthase [Euryarchaeota archaeon]MDE1836868.1 threonine synthase [Euryarchaeota archaeon]MDE1879747.1 threonine synthase [Euryarchaeota archaeon]MDE2046030.1 threonine synthase [Thermoplasmata archaeon]
MVSFLRDLICPACRRTFADRPARTFCQECGRTLVARYDLEQVKEKMTRDRLRARPPDLRRFEELLPIREARSQVSLGEMETPVLRVNDPELAPRGELWVKCDGSLPTGTFKARGMAIAVSKAKELGLQSLFVPTAGNAGAALAAYAARGSMKALVFMPQGAPESAQRQVEAYGGELRTVPGHIGDAARVGREEATRRRAFDVSTLREPWRAEGKKTMGLEIFWQMGREGMPSAIVYPTGGGTGLVGMHRAFTQLRELGWLDQVPRLYAAQSEGCAPVVEALRRGAEQVTPVKDPRTEAAGLRVPSPFSSEDILGAVRATRGGGVAVKETAIAPAARRFMAAHGISVARETGTALAGLRQLREEGAIDPQERVLVYNTGLWVG